MKKVYDTLEHILKDQKILRAIAASRQPVEPTIKTEKLIVQIANRINLNRGNQNGIVRAEQVQAFSPTTRSYTFPILIREDENGIRLQRERMGRRLEIILEMQSNNNNDNDSNEVAIPIYSTGVNASGYSKNYDDLPVAIQKIENATAKRREAPFLTSEKLGEDVLFAITQLAKKGRSHLTDWNIPQEVIDTLDDESVASIYKTLIDEIYKEGFGVAHIHKINDGTAQFRESAGLVINAKTGFGVILEDNPLYEEGKKYFISAYKQSDADTAKSIIQKNIGKNATLKEQEKQLAIIKKAAIEQNKLNENVFYNEYLTAEQKISKA